MTKDYYELSKVKEDRKNGVRLLPRKWAFTTKDNGLKSVWAITLQEALDELQIPAQQIVNITVSMGNSFNESINNNTFSPL